MVSSPVRAFVRPSATPDLPPPSSVLGPVAWMRQNLFGGPLSAVLTIASIAFVAWVTPGLVRWLFIDAIWSAPDGEACRAPGAGACWAYIQAKLSFFAYGSYPRDLVWRVDLTLVMGAALAVWLLWPDARRKALSMLLFFVVYPVVAFYLLYGMGAGSRRALLGLADLTGSPALGDIATNALPVVTTNPVSYTHLTLPTNREV